MSWRKKEIEMVDELNKNKIKNSKFKKGLLKLRRNIDLNLN